MANLLCGFLCFLFSQLGPPLEFALADHLAGGGIEVESLFVGQYFLSHPEAIRWRWFGVVD